MNKLIGKKLLMTKNLKSWLPQYWKKQSEKRNADVININFQSLKTSIWPHLASVLIVPAFLYHPLSPQMLCWRFWYPWSPNSLGLLFYDVERLALSPSWLRGLLSSKKILEERDGEEYRHTISAALENWIKSMIFIWEFVWELFHNLCTEIKRK